MDQVNAALNANLNILVIITLVMLAVSLLLLVGAAWTLIPQAHRTLFAIQKLVNTVETELEPTLSEAHRLVGGVMKLQDLAQQSVTGVTTKVEDVTGNVSKVADAAKKNSIVWSAGLSAGIKAYLEGNSKKSEPDKRPPAGSERRKLTKDRGEENVGFNG
jgi:uncharacterized protein YoxC